MIYLAVFLIILMIIFTFIYFLQEKLIFLKGEKISKEYQYNFTNKFEEIFITTKNENQINALHYKLENPKGIILFCHGNNGNLIKWGDRVSYFLNYNFEVLVFDYRNYGKSTGRFNEKEMYQDALLVYDYVKKDYKEENIVVYGFSLGSAFATKIASINSPQKLILEAPFFNLKKAVQFYFKFAPTFLLKYKFRLNIDIVKVFAPITVFHGNLDTVTSFKDAKKLLKLNTLATNKFIEIDGGTHHNIREFKTYKENLKEILEQ